MDTYNAEENEYGNSDHSHISLWHDMAENKREK